MEQFIKCIFDYLLANYAFYLVITMGVIIAVTNTILCFVKKPIKRWTAKIKNEMLRRLANKMFILFAFGISAICWWILTAISSYYFPFEALKVLLTGAFSIVIYAFGDGIINKNQAENLVENIKEIGEDNVVDEKDKDAIKEFWDKVK